MGKPTSQELQRALDEAAKMREHGEDPHFLAKSLLNTHYRLGLMEKVLSAADLYLRGEGSNEHAVLLRAIEVAKTEDAHPSGEDSNSLFI